jgi:predicted MFS family arabinose efflux permease
VWAASGVGGAVTIEWGWVVVGTISAIVFFVGGIIVFAIRKRQRRSPF